MEMGPNLHDIRTFVSVLTYHQGRPMNRISIACVWLAMLALSSPGLAQSPGDSLSRAGNGGPLIARSVSAATARAGLQPGAQSRLHLGSADTTAGQRIVTGAAAGLALGAIGLTVRDLMHGDRRGRSLGTDGAIVVSAGLIGALANYGRGYVIKGEARQTQ